MSNHEGEIMNIYQSEGFATRKQYLEHLAEDFGISKSDVFMIADLLGENEDFDGLVTTLEDYSEWNLFFMIMF